MKSVFSKKLTILLAALSLALTACNKTPSDGGAYKVRIPLDDHTGHYSLQTVELHTVTDINAMSGTVAAILAQGEFDTYMDGKGSERISSANLGSPPSAQFIDDDGVLRPADFESLAMTAIMYHFENIKKFYDQVQGNEGLSFPRTVLMDVKVARIRDGQEIDTVNNAAFVPSLDMFWVNPYKNAGVPLAFNGGVLAHEYLHSVFMARFHKQSAENVKRGRTTPAEFAELQNLTTAFPVNEWSRHPFTMPPLPPTAPTDTYPHHAPTDTGSTSNPPHSGPVPVPAPIPVIVEPLIHLNRDDLVKVNSFVFGGLNEGIADYFGYEYSRDPGWITASLPSQSFRDLSKEKTFAMTANGQQKTIIESFSGGGTMGNLDVHWFGAYFSRMLYLVSSDWGSADTELATIKFMDRYSDLYSSTYDKRFMSMGELVRLFFQDRMPSGQLCDQIKNLFSGELGNGSFACNSDDFSTGVYTR